VDGHAVASANGNVKKAQGVITRERREHRRKKKPRKIDVKPSPLADAALAYDKATQKAEGACRCAEECERPRERKALVPPMTDGAGDYAVGFDDFFLKEYERISEAYFSTMNPISQFMRHYLAVASLPPAIVALFGRNDPNNIPSTLRA
jgi:hypothetical protein